MGKGFYYNMNTCIGCGSCQVACKDHHRLLPGEFFRKAGIACVDIEGKQVHLPYSLSCNHCAKPACAAVCPTGAMEKCTDGLVVHNDDLCIGCGRCYWACPYGEVSFSLTRGMTQKCDTCRDLRAAGRPTACVAACPMSCLRFGDIADDEGEAPALPLLPDPGITQPTTRISPARVLKGEKHD